VTKVATIDPFVFVRDCGAVRCPELVIYRLRISGTRVVAGQCQVVARTARNSPELTLWSRQKALALALKYAQ
jgi:hypothetical protein